MFSTLLNNLALISILIIMYLASMLTNTILGLYNNISNIKESFSKQKLFSGLIKGGITLAGALAIAAIISLLPDVLLAFGIQSESNILESISVAAMGGVIASAVVRYMSDAIKKLYEILGMRMNDGTEREDG